MTQMHADLMRPLRQWLACQQRPTVKTLLYFERRARALASPGINPHQSDFDRVRREFRVNLERVRRGTSLHQCEVGLDRFFRPTQIRQPDEHWFGFRQQNDSTRLEIQSV